jgi:hypothetical protein
VRSCEALSDCKWSRPGEFPASHCLLNQLLPAEYRDAVRWTDLFSDLQLYSTRGVEVLE